MFNMKLPNGEGLFNTLEVKLACPDCLASDHPERCVHMTDEIPVSIGPLKMFSKNTNFLNSHGRALRNCKFT